MEENMNKHPFVYGFEEQRAYTSFYTQRNAEYKETAKEVFEPNELEVFRYGIEAPTPQLMQVDGYEAEE